MPHCGKARICAKTLTRRRALEAPNQENQGLRDGSYKIPPAFAAFVGL